MLTRFTPIFFPASIFPGTGYPVHLFHSPETQKGKKKIQDRDKENRTRGKGKVELMGV